VYIDCAYFSRRTLSCIDKLITDSLNRMNTRSLIYFGKLHKIFSGFWMLPLFLGLNRCEVYTIITGSFILCYIL